MFKHTILINFFNSNKMKLSDFSVTIPVNVAWGEMDAFGHVNNVVFFRYMESGRIAYFDKIDLNKKLKHHGLGPILAATECQYLKPLFYPDKLIVGIKVTEIKNTSFVMEQAIFSERSGLVATGKGVVVIFNYATQKKAPIPSELKSFIQKFED